METLNDKDDTSADKLASTKDSNPTVDESSDSPQEDSVNKKEKQSTDTTFTLTLVSSYDSSEEESTSSSSTQKDQSSSTASESTVTSTVIHSQSLAHLARMLLLPCIHSSIAHPVEYIRSAFITVLNSLVKHMPLSFPDLQCLLHCGSNNENIFELLVSLQKQSHVKAFTLIRGLLSDRLASPSYSNTNLFLTNYDNRCISLENKAREKSKTDAADALAAVVYPPETPAPTERSIVLYLMPLLRREALENSAVDKFQHVSSAALETMQALAQTLSWPRYSSYLYAFLMAVRAKRRLLPHEERVFLQLCCLWLDAFHFELTPPPPMHVLFAMPASQHFQRLHTLQMSSSSSSFTRSSGLSLPGTSRQRIVREQGNIVYNLSHRILRPLVDLVSELDPSQSLLEMFESADDTFVTQEDGLAGVLHTSALARTDELYANTSRLGGRGGGRSERAQMLRDAETHTDGTNAAQAPSLAQQRKVGLTRLHAAVAIVKLLQRLPASTGLLALHLPRVVLILASHLRSRMEDTRAAVRQTLVALQEVLGDLYLGFFVQEMRSALTRGYQRHVLSFTLRTLLDAAVARMRKQLHLKDPRRAKQLGSASSAWLSKADLSKASAVIDYCIPEIADVCFLLLLLYCSLLFVSLYFYFSFFYCRSPSKSCLVCKQRRRR